MPPKAAGGGKKSKAAKAVTNKRRRGFIDPDLRVSKRQERKDDEKFVKAKFGNFKAEGKKGNDGKATDDDGASSDSDSDVEKTMGKKLPRQRTHVFKNFATRVSEVDLDVHRTAGQLRIDPLAGSTSFFHETLVKCVELNCGSHFSDFKREAEPLCQSLPMLVLHQEKVLDCLLVRLVPEAKHSLEAILKCLQALARDLRGDFVTSSFEKSVNGIANMLKTDVAREPELLEFAFQALAFMCKWCQRQLVQDLPDALRKTKNLREHPRAHVRVFAAQAVAFLLRAAPDANVSAGICALLQEATRVESSTPLNDGSILPLKQKTIDSKLHGAGVLLAEATKGVAKGLHSRSARVLRVAFRPKHVFTKKENGDDDAYGTSTSYDSNDVQYERASKIAEHAVAALCKHTRRGKCGEMWAMILSASKKAAKTCVEGTGMGKQSEDSDDSDSESDDETQTQVSHSFSIRRLSRSVDVIATAVETYRGARVENYELIFEVLKKFILPALERAHAVEAINPGVTVDDVSLLSAAVHRLLLSLVDSHNIVAGASIGPVGVGRAALNWSVAITHSPPVCAFTFLQHLRDRTVVDTSEASLAVMSTLLPNVSTTLVELIDQGWDGDDSGVVDADAAAALLGDTCDALLQRAGDQSGTLLHSVAPDAAAAIVKRCQGDGSSTSASKKASKAQASTKKRTPPPARRRWAMLRFVPHCDAGEEAWNATSDALAWGLDVLEQKKNSGYALSDDVKETKATMAAALAARASLLSKNTSHSLAYSITSSVALALRAVCCGSDCPGVLYAGADVLKHAFQTDARVAEKSLLEALYTASEDKSALPLISATNLVSENLQHDSRTLRHSTLKFLCQVSVAVGELGVGDIEEVAVSTTPNSLGQLFALFEAINARDAADVTKTGVMEYAKTTQVAIASAARAVTSTEDDAFDPNWASPLAMCALGATRLRLSMLWPGLVKLLAALAGKQGSDDAWGTLFDGLEQAQNECLDAHDTATGAAKLTIAHLKTHGRRRGWIEVDGKGEHVEEDVEEEEDDDDTRDEETIPDKEKVSTQSFDKISISSASLVLHNKLSAFEFPEEQGVDRWTRFCTLLKCVASSPAAASKSPKKLALLFLAFDAPRADGSIRSGKAFRNGLREWLKVFLMSLGGGRQLKGLENGIGDNIRASLEKHVSADESELAQLSIKCLGQWRLPHLSIENAERLTRVADEKTMKTELISLHLSDDDGEGDGGGVQACVTAEHRAVFASLVVRCLLPRLKKRSGRHAPLRAAALAWIGRLTPVEIAPLVHAVVAPLEGEIQVLSDNTTQDSWYNIVAATGAGDETAKRRWQKLAKDAKVAELIQKGSKRPEGFLRAAHDLLKAAGEHVGYYLDVLLSLTLELLTEASLICEAAAEARADLVDADTGNQNNNDSNVSLRASREAKDVRAAATRFLASVLERHPAFDYSRYWPDISNALSPMAKRAAAESSSLNAAPPAVALIAAIASANESASLLLSDTNDNNFLSEVWHALGTQKASGQTRAAALTVAESLVERAELWRLEHSDEQLKKQGDGVAAELLRKHAPALLDALRGALAARASKGHETTVTNVTNVKIDGDTPTADEKTKDDDVATHDETTPSQIRENKKKLQKPDKKRGAANLAAGAAGRELEILKRLGPLLGRAAASAAVADVLVPVLGVKRLDESAATEVLHAFASVAPKPDSGSDDDETVADMKQAAARHRAALAPLFGRLRTRSARRALCKAFAAIGAWDAAAFESSKILEQLHSESKESIDGIDYDKRLDAYDFLNEEWFSSSPPAAATPIAHHLLHELRGKDMALRHAAAAVLARLLDAAVGGAAGSKTEGDTVGNESDTDDENDGATPQPFAKTCDVGSTLGDVVMRVVAPGVRGLLRAPDQTTRAEAIAAFRKLAKTWPQAAPGAFKLLADESDPEKDFFANAAHLQAHRRARALRRLSSAASKTAEEIEELKESGAYDEHTLHGTALLNLFPPETIVGYLAPLATAALGDPGADVASTAAAAVGALAGALPWSPYRDLLHATLRKASAGRGGRDGRGYDVEGSKALHIRAAATILEQFHEYDVDGENAMEMETGEQAIATNVVGRLIHENVVASLRLDILPKLEQLAVVEDNEGKGGTVRPAAAAATVAVLRLLPARDLDADISRVLGKMANCLRSRAQGVRDSARAALASASAGLGAAHLPSIVSLLTTRLDRGFMVHVLGATLFTILDATVNDESDPDDVEDALTEIIPVLDADVFGRAAQEREEVAAIRGAYKEARRSRAFECLTLLAQHAPMPDALPALLAPVTKRLAFASNQSLRIKLELYLQAVMRGFLRNKNASPEATLVLCYSVINDGISRDERIAEREQSNTLEEMTLGEQKRGVKETGNRVWENGWYLIKLPAPGSDKFVVEDAGLAAGDRYKKAKYGEVEEGGNDGAGKQLSGIAALAGSVNDVPPNFEILVVFALSLLRALLKKMSGEKGVGGKVAVDAEEEDQQREDDSPEDSKDPEDPEDPDSSHQKTIAGLSKNRRKILEGVVPLMARALQSPHAPVPPLATRCLAQLSTMRLNAFDKSTGALARRVMALLRECPRPGENLAQDCMKLLNNLLKRHSGFTPTEAQFRFLVTFCFGDLEGDQREGHRSTTFSLLRAVLARRPLLPEIYDVMKTVSSLIVRAGALETRSLCSQALVQFLLDYPLGERRLRQHIDALAANLEYQYASGRLSALQCIKAVVVKFPKEVVMVHSPFLFVPLVARLGADEDAQCRRGAGEALAALLGRVEHDPGTITKLLSLCVGWLRSTDDKKSVSDDPRLARAAMQTLGLATSAAPGHASLATRAARRRIVEALIEHDPTSNYNINEFDDDDTAYGWQTAYHALLLLEKMSAKCPKSLSDTKPVDENYAAQSKLSDVQLDKKLDHVDAPWAAAQALLTHRHQWVQQASARVVGRYLAEHGGAIAAETISKKESKINQRPIRLESVARACVSILEQSTGVNCVELDDGLVEQTVKNLTFATVVLIKASPSDAEAIMALDEENGLDGEADGDGESDDSEDDVDTKNDSNKKPVKMLRPPVPWLFRRLGKVGAGGVGAARAGVLRWTAAVAQSLGNEGFNRNASVAKELVLPNSLCVDESVQVEDAHRELAAEVLDILRNQMPGDLFSRASAEVKSRINQRRQDRRKRKALEQVTDPERAARIKINKNEKKTAAKKRKIQEFRHGKGSAGSSKRRAKEV